MTENTKPKIDVSAIEWDRAMFVTQTRLRCLELALDHKTNSVVGPTDDPIVRAGKMADFVLGPPNVEIAE